MISCYTLREPAPVPMDPGVIPNPVPSSPEEVRFWIDLVNPSEEEYAVVSRRFSIPLAHLTAALDFNERPRVEFEDGILLVIARTPFRDDPVRHVTFSTCPIAVILTPRAVVTVCLKDGIAQPLLFRKILGTGPGLGERLVLSLLLRISSCFIEQLQVMDDHVGDMEQALKESMRNQELINMLRMEKSLIYFLTALKGNQSVMDKLRSATPIACTAHTYALLDDVIIENRQATDMAEIYTQIMGTISDAFGAIVSNNLNKVMKVLTGLTIVFMIPTIIGALYGMNVALPFAEHPHAFAVLCLLCFGLSAGVWFVLRKMDWM